MKYLILLSILVVIIMSMVSFEDVEAYYHGTVTLTTDQLEYEESDTITIQCTPDNPDIIQLFQWRVYNTDSKYPVITNWIGPTKIGVPESEITIEPYKLIPGDYRVVCVGEGHHQLTPSAKLFFSVISETPPPIKEEVLSAIGNGTNSTLPEASEIFPTNPSKFPIFHPGQSPFLGKFSHYTNNDKNGGKDSCNDCTAPTIGVDTHGKRFVDYGLTLNDKSFQANYFKTIMSQQYTEIGKENHLTIKVYENNGAYNIDYIQFGMVKEIGSPINTFEPRLEIDIKNTSHDIENPVIESILLVDKNNIINNYRVNVSLTSCMEGYNHQCLQLDIYWTFDKVPFHNVLAINGWDNRNNSFTTYFNHGIIVNDPNYTEPEPAKPYKYECKDPLLHTIKNAGDRNNCHWRALHMGWLWK